MKNIWRVVCGLSLFLTFPLSAEKVRQVVPEFSISEDRIIDGYPIKAGRVEVSSEGELSRGTLSKAWMVHGVELPANARIRLSYEGQAVAAHFPLPITLAGFTINGVKRDEKVEPPDPTNGWVYLDYQPFDKDKPEKGLLIQTQIPDGTKVGGLVFRSDTKRFDFGKFALRCLDNPCRKDSKLAVVHGVLHEDAKIDGIECKAGEGVTFDEKGKLARLDLVRAWGGFGAKEDPDRTVAGVKLVRSEYKDGTQVIFAPTGKITEILNSGATTYQGVPISGMSNLTFYPSGKLKSATGLAPQTIGELPVASDLGHSDSGNRTFAEFYESGKLKRGFVYQAHKLGDIAIAKGSVVWLRENGTVEKIVALASGEALEQRESADEAKVAVGHWSGFQLEERTFSPESKLLKTRDWQDETLNPQSEHFQSTAAFKAEKNFEFRGIPVAAGLVKLRRDFVEHAKLSRNWEVRGISIPAGAVVRRTRFTEIDGKDPLYLELALEHNERFKLGDLVFGYSDEVLKETKDEPRKELVYLHLYFGPERNGWPARILVNGPLAEKVKIGNLTLAPADERGSGTEFYFIADRFAASLKPKLGSGFLLGDHTISGVPCGDGDKVYLTAEGNLASRYFAIYPERKMDRKIGPLEFDTEARSDLILNYYDELKDGRAMLKSARGEQGLPEVKVAGFTILNGAATFYPTGEIKTVTGVAKQKVQGISVYSPRGFRDSWAVGFHPNGKLRQGIIAEPHTFGDVKLAADVFFITNDTGRLLESAQFMRHETYERKKVGEPVDVIAVRTFYDERGKVVREQKWPADKRSPLLTFEKNRN